MTTTVAETSFSPVEATTEHQWSFNNWSSRYLYYDGINSPKIKINGVHQCTCEISLDLKAGSASCLRMNISDITHFIAISTTTSLLNIRGSQLWTAKAELCTPTQTRYCSSIAQTIPNLCNSDEMKKYLQNDTLIVHVKFTVLQSVTFSPCPDDVYSLNFAKIVQGNSEALREFKRSSDVVLFVGNCKLSIVKLIFFDKDKVFQCIFNGAETKEVEKYTISLRDTEIETFVKFCDYLEKGTMTNVTKIDDKFINVAKHEVGEIRTLCKDYIGKRFTGADVTPKTILNYVLVTYQLLCKVFRAQALNFMKVNGRTDLIPQNYQLFAKYVRLVSRRISSNNDSLNRAAMKRSLT